MTEPMVLPLFSSPVYAHDTGYKPTQEEIDYVSSLDMSSEGNASAQLTSNTQVLDLPKLNNIKTLCDQELRYYTNQVLRIKQSFRITNSWLTIKKQDQWHHLHNHQNCIFSGVYYLQTPPDAVLNFEGDPGFRDSFKFNYDYIDYNIFNSHSWKVSVPASTVVIFPSSLYHDVAPNLTTTPRICIGFNAFVTGKLATKTYCSDLTL